MALGEKIVDGAISLAPGLIPAQWKKQAGAWLQDHNPFASIADNGDLRRALRLAFIDAANEVLSAAEKAAENPEWAGDANPARYIDLARPLLRDLRAVTFDRRPILTALPPLDSLLSVALRGVVESELLSSAADAAAQLTGCFATVMAGIAAEDPPPLLIRLANEGVTTHAGPRRAFGPLLCAALAEILKKPQEYPEARAAFDMVMTAQTQDKLDEHTAKLDEILATLRAGGVLQQAADKGIPEAAVRAIVERLGGQGVAGDDLLRWLEGWIDAAQRELSRQPDPDKAFAAAADEAARRFREGRLAEASGAFMDLFEQEEAQHRQRQTRLLQEAIRYDELALNPAAAVDKLRRLAALTGVAGPDLGEWLSDRAGEYYQRGEEKGDNAALLVAIEVYRSTLLEWPCDRVPLDWAATQNNLGNALQALGGRESSPARLEAAVAAHQSALQEYTSDRAPQQWAATQSNLGNTLTRLGERESGRARLEAAVAAYQATLLECTRERAPLDWAITQNNLGNALRILGERETETNQLKAAVIAYQAALQEYASEEISLDRAMTQNNLGNALSILGKREGDAAWLEAAVTTYELALLGRTRERVPLQWAGTQNNRGNALRALGERENDPARLGQAVAAYQSALLEYTRDRAPLDWAMTQNNLGIALQALGERESGTARLEQAVAAYQAALQEYTCDRVPLYWAGTQNNLGGALSALGEREGDAARLEQGIQHISDALALYREANHAPGVAMAESNLSLAQTALENVRRPHP